MGSFLVGPPVSAAGEDIVMWYRISRMVLRVVNMVESRWWGGRVSGRRLFQQSKKDGVCSKVSDTRAACHAASVAAKCFVT